MRDPLWKVTTWTYDKCWLTKNSLHRGKHRQIEHYVDVEKSHTNLGPFWWCAWGCLFLPCANPSAGLVWIEIVEPLEQTGSGEIMCKSHQPLTSTNLRRTCRFEWSCTVLCQPNQLRDSSRPYLWFEAVIRATQINISCDFRMINTTQKYFKKTFSRANIGHSFWIGTFGILKPTCLSGVAFLKIHPNSDSWFLWML